MSLRFVALSVVGAAWLALCIWTARRLLSEKATRRRVLWSGLPIWLGIAAWRWMNRADGELFSPWALLSLGVALLVGFPIAMWGSYFVEKILAGSPVRRPGPGEG